MFSEKNQGKKQPHQQLDQQQRVRLLDARLDEISRGLARAARASEAEIDAGINAPFLYARLRSRIHAKAENIIALERNNLWAMFLTAWRPLTGMALMTLCAAVLFWFTALAGTTATNVDLTFGGSDYLANGNSSFERIVFTDGNAPSNDEVLTTLLNQDETDVPR